MSVILFFANLNAFVSAYAQSDFFGKLIFWGLYISSAICWIVLLYKIWVLRKTAQLAKNFRAAWMSQKDYLFQIDSQNLPSAQKKEVPNIFSEIFLSLKEKTLQTINKNLFFAETEPAPQPEQTPARLSVNDLNAIESHVLTTISSQSKKLESNLYILSTMVTLAPFLGLLGTVWGILVTFAELQNGGTASSNTAILGGISTALATTVLGLVIAIPALLSFNYLRNLTKTLSSEMEDFMYEMLSVVELQYRKTDGV